MKLFIKNTLILAITVVSFAITFGLNGTLVAYQENADNMGLIWASDTTEYRVYFWPFLTQTNDLPPTNPETIFTDMKNYPFHFLGDVMYWLAISALINGIPILRRYILSRRKKTI